MSAAMTFISLVVGLGCAWAALFQFDEGNPRWATFLAFLAFINLATFFARATA